MQHPIPPQTPRRRAAVINRLAAIMCHIPWYSTLGPSRLAADTGLSIYTIERLLEGDPQPAHYVLFQVAQAISKRMGRHLDIQEIATVAGNAYLTEFPCQIFGCRCLPEWARTRDGDLKPGWEHVKPGTWTMNGTSKDVIN